MSKYSYTDDYLENYNPLGKAKKELDGKIIAPEQIISSDNRNLLDTFAVEQVIRGKVTPSLIFSPSYQLSGTLGTFKKPKPKPPRVLAFRIIGVGASQAWRPLPYYKMQTTLESTTNSFFIDEWAKVFVYKDRVDITGNTTSSSDQEFIVFVLREKRKGNE